MQMHEWQKQDAMLQQIGVVSRECLEESRVGAWEPITEKAGSMLFEWHHQGDRRLERE